MDSRKILGIGSVITSSILVTVLIQLLSDTAQVMLYRIFGGSTLLVFLIGGVSSLILLVGFQFVFRNQRVLPRYNVAIIGFPQSGKTTLITSIFGEIFAQKVSNYHATPSGETTIERVNANLRRLESGRALGPTKDQDVFAFRTVISPRQGLFRQSYAVEFGDFPGENSMIYTKKYGDWFHTTPFFKWVASADAIIFIIDLARYLYIEGRVEYVAEMSSAIRASIQHLYQFEEEGQSRIKDRPMALVFTKSDVIDYITQPGEIEDIGFSRSVPELHEIDISRLESLKPQIESDFLELASYIKAEIKHFKIIYTSCFGFQPASEGKQRLGLLELLNFILPK